jgi:hypothetical protein
MSEAGLATAWPADTPCNTMSHRTETRHVTLRAPRPLVEAFAEKAKASERTVSQELRALMRSHVAKPDPARQEGR